MSVGVGNNWKSMMNWFSVPVVNYIQVWSAVLHSVFFHTHECGIRIGLGIGIIAFSRTSLSSFTMPESMEGVNFTDVSLAGFSCTMAPSTCSRRMRILFSNLVRFFFRRSYVRQKYICWPWIQSWCRRYTLRQD